MAAARSWRALPLSAHIFFLTLKVATVRREMPKEAIVWEGRTGSPGQVLHALVSGSK